MYSVTFLRYVVYTVGLHHPILAVDPSPHMLEIAKGRQGLDTMEATFDQFIESGIVRNYHKFVCIGCVHHFPQLPLALKRFCSLLNDGDQLLIIEEPEPALWDTARKAARKMSVDELEGYLKMAGFSDVKRREDMQSRVYKRDEYFDCLHNRCYSVLSIFTDEEIERGLTELNETVFEGAEYKELPDIKTGLLATK